MDESLSYTAWACRYPWHVSDESYPYDSHKGNCICKCEYCQKQGTHRATRKAHLVTIHRK